MMFIWASIAQAASWERVDDPTFAALAQWTNEVELGDLDSDGDLDVVLANGGDYSSAGDDEPSWWLQNDGTGSFVAVELVTGQHRTAKIRDFDGDDIPDVFLPGAWQTRSVLLRGDGAGGLVDASAGLPDQAGALLSVGDAEPGDIDGDGDLDLVLSDSGVQNALFSQGEVTRLWLNDGLGSFTDATDVAMPDLPIRWSWDLELVDVDLDHDLDVAISCKTCTGSSLFTNDGTGVFTDRSDSGLPQPRANNYEFEALDLTGDALPDLVTINDGPGLDERILVNDGVGAFQDETDTRLPPDENLGADDNVLVMLDPDSDGDVDVLIGSLNGADRLLVNDGTGHFTTDAAALDGPNTPGTLALAAGDLDGDGRLDLVMGQGELATGDSWYRGVDIAPDTQGPAVGLPVGLPEDPSPQWPLLVQVTAHDLKTPVLPDDLSVTVEWVVGSSSGSLPLRHAGGTLWRGWLDALPEGAGTAQSCATDRAGNTACTAYATFGSDGPDDTGNLPTDGPTDGTTDTGEVTDPVDAPPAKGCGCGSGTPARGRAGFPARGSAGAVLLALAWRRRVSRQGASG